MEEADAAVEQAHHHVGGGGRVDVGRRWRSVARVHRGERRSWLSVRILSELQRDRGSTFVEEDGDGEAADAMAAPNSDVER